MNAVFEGALAGLKVIDLTRVLGGPYCTMVLSDHGADVIKIEPPQGDETRDWGPPFLDGDASYFIGVNRNKRSIGLDLGRPEGRAVLLRLLDGADVLIENFKPPGMEKWGLGYTRDLAPLFPRLIHCRISGFGGDGPLGGLPGYDAILQAMTGLMSINGEPASGGLRMGTPIVDLATGLYCAIGIMMALHERTRSGRGQYLDMTLYDCGLAMLHPQAANFFLNGRRPVPLGNRHPNLAPYEKYMTKTGLIFIACGNDGQFGRLCELAGKPELASDPRFRSNADRLANRDALIGELQAVLAEEDGRALAERALHLGVPVGPVLAVDEALAAPQTGTRQILASLDGYRGIGTPIRFSRTPGSVRRKPPRFAEHTDEVLAAHGFTAAEVAELKQSGALRTVRRK
jgi:formyl-CoA transferase